LCERCHELETRERGEAERRLLFALRKAGFFAEDVHKIAAVVDRTPPIYRHKRLFTICALDKIVQAIQAIIDEDS
jgi:hypothetical protein